MIIIYGLLSIPTSTVSVVFCARFIVGTVKLFILAIESNVLKRKRIYYFRRKLIFIQVLLNLLAGLIYSAIVHNMYLYDRHFLDSIYFVFVTISTIGFGDISYNVDDNLKKKGVKDIILSIGEFIVFYVSFSLLASLIDIIVSHDTGSWKNMKKWKNQKGDKYKDEKEEPAEEN